MQSCLKLVDDVLHCIFQKSDLHDYLYGVVCYMYDMIPSFLTWYGGDFRASEII